MRPDRGARSGTILILVVGITALLLSLATAFLIQVRSDADGGQVVNREAQARIMLSAALHYLQETSRLGWGGGDPGAEAFGWTDVRDGEAGPRGPVDAAGAIPRLGWAPGGGFPAEGGAMRGDCLRWELPPQAVRLTRTPNPLILPPAIADEAVVTEFIGRQPSLQDMGPWATAIDASYQQGVGLLDPQPVADTWADFRQGRRIPVPRSANRAWFRIYRELDAERDGDGTPWYDTVPVAGHATFIVTCGAGATRGFRFWNQGNDWLGGVARSAPFERRVEPVTAEESGLFDEIGFRSARQEERIQWFRVEWTASSGGRLDVSGTLQNAGSGNRLTGMLLQTGRLADSRPVPSLGGAIRWIQRLEREPPRW